MNKTCDKCNKKSMILFKCKCDLSFCKKHKYADKHDCKHDFKQNYQDKLKKENSKVAPDKLIDRME